MAKQPKIAIVCDWLTNMGGAERVVHTLHKAFPGAPIYTSVYEPEKMPLFKNADMRTSWLQKLPPFIRRKHQLYAPLRAHAFRKLDLKEYDIIISSASAEAKAVNKRPDAKHFCYCHTPIRYYWSHYEEYRKDPGFGKLDPIIKPIIPPFVAWMRKLDYKSIKGIDQFIANSTEVKKRIKQYYHRDSVVIFPPVDTKRLAPKKPVKKEDYYLCVGRQIPYKRFDLAIEACNKLGKKLIVIGNGSEHEKLKAMAGPTIQFVQADDQEIVDYFQKAKGFFFPQYEDFGVVAVEAMSAGTPVIAYKKGGALDFMVEGETGVFFDEQNVDSLIKAIKKFETKRFSPTKLQKHAEHFSEEVFVKSIKSLVF